MPDLKHSAPTDPHVPPSTAPLSPADTTSEDGPDGGVDALTYEQRADAAEAAVKQVAAVLRRRDNHPSARTR